MDDYVFVPVIVAVVLGILFIGLPWLILHYLTKWKQAKSLTIQDENLLDELHDIARSLDGRMHTIERIIAADRADLPARNSERPAERIADYRAEIHTLEPRSAAPGSRDGSQSLRKEG